MLFFVFFHPILIDFCKKNALCACSGSTGEATTTGYTGMTLDLQVTNSGGFDVYDLGTASAGVPGSRLVLCFAYTDNYVFEVGTSRRALALTVTRQKEDIETTGVAALQFQRCGCKVVAVQSLLPTQVY